MTCTQYLAEMKHQTKLDIPIDGQDVARGLLAHIQSLRSYAKELEEAVKSNKAAMKMAAVTVTATAMLAGKTALKKKLLTQITSRRN